MEDEIYKPHTFGLSIRIPHEMMEDDPIGIMAQVMRDQCRIFQLRMDIEMGVGLSPSDAKFLLERFDALAKEKAKLQVAMDAKPPPSLFWSLRAWLAQKIKPEPEHDDDY